jgi:hypothetical protein
LGIHLKRQNQLALRHTFLILLDFDNPIHHHTYQGEFWLEELDTIMCLDANACEQLCKQFCKAPRLTYKLTNYKLKYPNDCDYGLVLDFDVVKVAILSQSDVYDFKFSTVSKFFDLYSLGDNLYRIYPYKLIDAFYINISGAFLVPKTNV